MTDEDIARFFLTHIEHFTLDGDHYIRTIQPSHPRGLLPGSAAHLEGRIAQWAEELRKRKLASA